MEQSDNIGELATALSKAQSQMVGAKKDSSNPYFKSTYADLSSVWDACRQPLTDNGLSVTQTSDILTEFPDYVVIFTQLNHSSGQWIRSKLAMKPVKNDPQAIGSCITYARRYSLSAIVGISPEDDDGNAASSKNGNDSAKESSQQENVNIWINNINDIGNDSTIKEYRSWWAENKEAINHDCGTAGAAKVYNHYVILGKKKANNETTN